jgi:hypothetical protein
VQYDTLYAIRNVKCIVRNWKVFSDSILYIMVEFIFNFTFFYLITSILHIFNIPRCIIYKIFRIPTILMLLIAVNVWKGSMIKFSSVKYEKVYILAFETDSVNDYVPYLLCFPFLSDPFPLLPKKIVQNGPASCDHWPSCRGFRCCRCLFWNTFYDRTRLGDLFAIVDEQLVCISRECLQSPDYFNIRRWISKFLKSTHFVIFDVGV